MSRPGQSSQAATRLLRSLFSDYYRGARLELPPDMEKREFAFQYLGSHTYHRHLSFRDEKSLRGHLVSKAPAHAYYSSALFLFPEISNMEEKKRLGSDLIFDIDADDLPQCTAVPRAYVCLSCGHAFRASGVNRCPRCGSGELENVDTLPQDCMARALENLRRLHRVLSKDLGLPRARAYFSGSRGYHLHVECDDRCRSMDSEDRRELVDYLKGTGLEIERVLGLGSRRRLSKDLLVPQPSEPGWRGRLGEAIALAHGSLPLGTTLAQLEEIAGGRLDWEVYVERARVHVDEKVTIDVHRLVRIPGSINGKTGLPVTRVDLEAAPEEALPQCSWSPFRERVFLVKMLHDTPGPISIFGETLRARRGQLLRLDGCVAAYLLLKGLAEPVADKS